MPDVAEALAEVRRCEEALAEARSRLHELRAREVAVRIRAKETADLTGIDLDAIGRFVFRDEWDPQFTEWIAKTVKIKYLRVLNERAKGKSIAEIATETERSKGGVSEKARMGVWRLELSWPHRSRVLTADSPISEMWDVSVRTYNVMCNLPDKAPTLRDVAAYTPKQLLEMKNFGPASLVELCDKLRDVGLELADRPTKDDPVPKGPLPRWGGW